jgi:hypothetical protein
MMKPTPEVIQDQTAQESLLIRPLSYVLDICGWARAGAARQENLEPLHVTFLTLAAWEGRVSFDRIHRETGVPRYAVSRAAAFLDHRRYGKVKPDKGDRRWKRLHITLLGLKCCERIDSVTAQFLMMRFRKDYKTFQRDDVFSYYSFASHIYNAARSFPDPLRVLGPRGFPDMIAHGSDLNAQQRELIHFLEEVQRAAEFLEERRRSSQKRGNK